MSPATPVLPTRRVDQDVTATVRVSDPAAVEAAVRAVFAAGPLAEGPVAPLREAFALFGRIYAGREPGWVGCDTRYHDAQHSLDVALATARLLDGQARDARAGSPATTAVWLGPRRAALGVIGALFHDVGYVRRMQDLAHNGAVFTLCHVERSGAALERLLPGLGFSAAEAALMHALIHFTGYEQPLDGIVVADPADRLLGHAIATADLLAQTADHAYLERCRDFLYPEFEIAGLAGPRRPGGPKLLYADIDTLLTGTPKFNAGIWENRLDGVFAGLHGHLGTHFGTGYSGVHPYRTAIEANLARIAAVIEGGADFAGLDRVPRAITATVLGSILDGTDSG